MDLKSFIADPDQRDALATALDSSSGYLWQLATGWRGRRPSAEFAIRIEAATGGRVSRAELRPDLWSGGEPAQPDTPAPSAAEQRAA